MKKNLKVVHVPKNVAGVPATISEIERENGLDSQCFSIGEDKYVKNSVNCIYSGNSFIATLKDRFSLFVKVFKSDVVVYNFGRSIFDWQNVNHRQVSFFQEPLLFLKQSIVSSIISLLQWADIKVFRFLGKRIIVIYQGDDARQFQIISRNRIYYPATENVNGRDEWNQKAIKFFSEYAHHIFYLNPDLGHVLPQRSKFLPYPQIKLEEWEPQFQQNANPIILHAPTNRPLKGTPQILQAVEKLKNEGWQFDFKLIENLPRHEAKEIYKQCDLLIDQIVIGWYGGLAVELMALGKPVMAYLHDQDLKFIPEKMQKDIPILSANTETIYHALKAFLSKDIEERTLLGKKSRQFVEKWHDPEIICRNLEKFYI